MGALCDIMLEKLNSKGEQEDDSLMEDQDVLDYERWKGHLLSFCKRGRYNISEISDIYDSCKHDLISGKIKDGEDGFELLKKIYKLSKRMADIVVPNEYGISEGERWNIGTRICSELMKKLGRDFSAMRQQSELGVLQILEQEERMEDDS